MWSEARFDECSWLPLFRKEIGAEVRALFNPIALSADSGNTN